ncbi:hypothetical protein D8674_028718 [Pyrus ussuriensis x Pyrus communis]|uniref:Uncharacterized protein n=1 Tax=Pyrus ussuriensis x Pyrus communis TaxID=2448454 RepID=A0A5N5I1X3_9ROSA|nr:hypothetical protein D8674_028718 [Pyrus ussuriensis x Pyrus communis]
MQSTKRGNMSITEYVDKLTNFADQLAFAGKPIDDDNLMELILNVVCPAFESAVTSVKARENLMNYSTTFSPDHTTTALFAPSGSSTNHGRGNTLHRGNDRTSLFRRGGFQGRDSFHGHGAGNHFVGRCGGSNNGLFHGGSSRGSFQSRYPFSQSHAMMAASPVGNERSPTWYTDSGASSHITNDLANLSSIHGEYAFPRQE